jgi:ribose 5-phosphate isomerase B
MRIGLAADHGGFALKAELSRRLSNQGYSILDFGASQFNPTDDYPDYMIPLAQAVAQGDRIERGIAICGSGVGACIAANKVLGVRACLIYDYYSAHQGVEHDDMNLLCLGGLSIGEALAWDLTMAFLNAHFTGEERHQRRLNKISAFEKEQIARRTANEPESAYHA